MQLIGGIVLHQGRIAEMKTGEGKTLVATLPAYLNALTGKGVHIVTVNDYLAKPRLASGWARYTGSSACTVGLIVHDMDNDERRAAYACRHHLRHQQRAGLRLPARQHGHLQERAWCSADHNFAIVDEVDSILIDEARTPLIISGHGREVHASCMNMADRFATRLKKYVVAEMDDKEDEDDDIDADYIVDEKAKTATLTARGVAQGRGVLRS